MASLTDTCVAGRHSFATVIIFRCLREIPEGDGFITHLHPGSIDNSMTSELSTPFDVFKVLQQQGATVSTFKFIALLSIYWVCGQIWHIIRGAKIYSA